MSFCIHGIVDVWVSSSLRVNVPLSTQPGVAAPLSVGVRFYFDFTFLSIYLVNKSCLFDRIFIDLHDASRLCCVVGDAATGVVCRRDPWSRPTEGSSFKNQYVA